MSSQGHDDRHRFPSDVAFSPSVKAVQQRLGSRATYARVEETGGWSTTVTDELAAFVAERDSFFLATASADGQPYVQHRGGPPGFLKVLDERTLGFADFAGNRQYVSVGNLADNDRVCLFLMDHAHRRRVKIWGRMAVVEDDPELLDRLADSGYPGRPERAFVLTLEAWDVNCPQHITPRFTLEELEPTLGRLRVRVLELEAEVERLRSRSGGDADGRPEDGTEG